MRKIFAPAFFVFLFQLHSQAQNKPAAMQQTVDNICGCLQKINPDTANLEAYKQKGMECFTTTEAMNDYLTLAEEKKIDVTNEEAMHNLGVEVGKELLIQRCASYIKYSTVIAQNKAQNLEKTEAETVKRQSGKIVRIETKDFRYIVLKDISEREYNFIWLGYFSGSENFLGEKIKKFIGKNATISWKDKEVYLPAINNYHNLKEIININIGE